MSVFAKKNSTPNFRTPPEKFLRALPVLIFWIRIALEWSQKLLGFASSSEEKKCSRLKFAIDPPQKAYFSSSQVHYVNSARCARLANTANPILRPSAFRSARCARLKCEGTSDSQNTEALGLRLG